MKNTRIFYTDDAHIKMYEALPAEDFKELLMAMLKYKYGDDSIVKTINNPVVQALFMREKTDIDNNEEKWAERAKTNRENGAKGGRPKKVEEPQPIMEEPKYNYAQFGDVPRPIFGTQGELVDYLVEYSKGHKKDEIEYERNILCNQYRFSSTEVMNELKERTQ